MKDQRDSSTIANEIPIIRFRGQERACRFRQVLTGLCYAVLRFLSTSLDVVGIISSDISSPLVCCSNTYSRHSRHVKLLPVGPILVVVSTEGACAETASYCLSMAGSSVSARDPPTPRYGIPVRFKIHDFALVSSCGQPGGTLR